MTNQDIAAPFDWCIAGGFAVCPQLAADCDVWVLGVPEHYYEASRKAILNRLRSNGVNFDEEENDGEGYETDEVRIWKVAELADGRHILLTSAPTADDLIAAFDVSTHACAITSSGEFVKHPKWTPINVPPVELRDTDTTPFRMQRIRERYKGFYDPGVDFDLDVNTIEADMWGV